MRTILGFLATAGALALMGTVAPAGAQAPTTSAAGSARAPSASDVAAAVAESGWYADGGAVGDREQLAGVAERLADQGHHLGFALLAAEPPGGSPAFAGAVLDALPRHGETTIRTVIVLSDADVGLVSDVWDDAAIDDALDETIDELRADPTDGLEALAESLASQPSGDDVADGGDGPGIGWLVVGGIVLAAVSVGNRLLRGSRGGSGMDDRNDDRYSDSWRRRRRSALRSSRRRSSGSGGRSRRRSSGRSRRGRGGRRL